MNSSAIHHSTEASAHNEVNHCPPRNMINDLCKKCWNVEETLAKSHLINNLALILIKITISANDSIYSRWWPPWWTHTKNSCFIAIAQHAVLRTPDHQSEGAHVPPGEFASLRAASITAAKNSTSVIDGAGYFCWGRENLLNAWHRHASQTLTAGRFLSFFCRLMFNPFGHICNTNTLNCCAKKDRWEEVVFIPQWKSTFLSQMHLIWN